MKDQNRKWKKRKEYLQDPEKPRGYCVGCMGLFPDELLEIE